MSKNERYEIITMDVKLIIIVVCVTRGRMSINRKN